MRLTIEKTEAINNKFNADKNLSGLEITDSLGSTAICKGMMVFAKVEELSDLISDLQLLKKIIEDETGVIL